MFLAMPAAQVLWQVIRASDIRTHRRSKSFWESDPDTEARLAEATMIDLHTHSTLSDGALIPAELVRRCQAKGYRAVAITDHVGPSNLDFVIESLTEFCEAVAGAYKGIEVLPGCELTHVPPLLIPRFIDQARDCGAELVLVHGETIVEPVKEGTNRAAIEAGADVLAHPGLVSEDDVRRAAEMGVRLELSGRRGHSLTNGHVARLALEHGAKLVFGSDGHAPGDYPTRAQAERILHGAGLDADRVAQVLRNNESVFAEG
jgi:histidinol phosphatase-like PHP family hydrolase